MIVDYSKGATNFCMATFAKATFNAVKYATSRPTYPRALFNAVLAYHAQSLSMPGATTGWNRALDLGCGTGQATIEILKQARQAEEQDEEQDEDSLPRFNQVIGVDPSSKMVSEAQVLTAKLGLPDSAIRFVQSPAEDLHFVEDKSVDLVIAGTMPFLRALLFPQAARSTGGPLV